LVTTDFYTSHKNEKNRKVIILVTFLIIFASKIFELKIFSRGTLRDFWVKHADCELQLKTWYRETAKSNWKTINELKSEYPNASILKDNRIVFNIKGNDYRLIVKFNFEYQLAWIRFIGTHVEYDKINANEI
jgi:mRNA interferase HigB